MQLSHAEVGFCDFLQSLFAVTCHSSWSAMQVILPMLALSLYFTDGGNDSIYNAGYLQCIRSGFQSLMPGVDITPAQKICNNRMENYLQL
jgi:hypothetical protein